MAVSGEDWGPPTIIEVYTTFIDAMNQARAIAGPLSAELEASAQIWTQQLLPTQCRTPRALETSQATT